MLQRLLAARGFYIGSMFHGSAERHGDVRVTLDRVPQTMPELGLEPTVARLAEAVDELAARLWAVGVRPSERVAVYKTNNIDIALLACAAARIGAVPALLAPALDRDTVVELLRRLGKPWLVSDGDHLARMLGDVDLDEVARETLLSAGAARPGTIPLRDYAGAPRRTPVLLHPREPALITHSSGTTGVPKLAVHSADSLWHRMLPQKVMAWPIRKKEAAALCMTFVHSRFYNALQVALDYGNPLVLAVDHDPASIGPLFARTRPGYVETHPNTFIEWEALVDAPDRPLASVGYFVGTFDAMHPRTIQRLLSGSARRRPLFLQFYGQSETGPVTGRWYTRRSAAKTDGRCIGLPLPGFVRMRIVGPDGRPVPRGQAGHVEVKVRSRILTYLNEDERYKSQLDHGWWRMGDMGSRDRWGLLYLLDREVDQIDSMASNLAAEDALMSRLDELREVVIVAGSRGEPIPVVCTRDDRPLDPARWREATRDLPAMADPVLFGFEDFPRTSTAKIRRPELTRILSERG